MKWYKKIKKTINPPEKIYNNVQAFLTDLNNDPYIYDFLIKAADPKKIEFRIPNNKKENLALAQIINANDSLNLFHTVAKKADVKAFELVLSLTSKKKLKFYINSKDNDGNSPLHYLVAKEYDSPEKLAEAIELINHMVKNGANLNLPNNEGKTPLQEAIANGHPDIAKAMKQYAPTNDLNEEEVLKDKVQLEQEKIETPATSKSNSIESNASVIPTEQNKLPEGFDFNTLKSKYNSSITKKFQKYLEHQKNTGAFSGKNYLEKAKSEKKMAEYKTGKAFKLRHYLEPLFSLGGIRKTDNVIIQNLVKQYEAQKNNPKHTTTYLTRYNKKSKISPEL